jgi:hypothetical protein
MKSKNSNKKKDPINIFIFFCFFKLTKTLSNPKKRLKAFLDPLIFLFLILKEEFNSNKLILPRCLDTILILFKGRENTLENNHKVFNIELKSNLTMEEEPKRTFKDKKLRLLK